MGAQDFLLEKHKVNLLSYYAISLIKGAKDIYHIV